jgi:hypothetical protein
MIRNDPAAFIPNSTEITRLMVGGDDEQVFVPAPLGVLRVINPVLYRLNRLSETEQLPDSQIQIVMMVTAVDGPSFYH